jgi:hypothetical protein
MRVVDPNVFEENVPHEAKLRRPELDADARQRPVDCAVAVRYVLHSGSDGRAKHEPARNPLYIQTRSTFDFLNLLRLLTADSRQRTRDSRQRAAGRQPAGSRQRADSQQAAETVDITHRVILRCWEQLHPVAYSAVANETCRNASFFECFPYMCAEPVLVK